jgi:hypothetical protein
MDINWREFLGIDRLEALTKGLDNRTDEQVIEENEPRLADDPFEVAERIWFLGWKKKG